MAYIWQTVEEAAVSLGISTRTLHRRLARNDLQTRMENGRREVLVCLPDSEPADAADGGRAAEDPQPAIVQPAQHLSDEPSDSALMLAEESMRRADLALAAFQQSAAAAQQELRRVRTVGYAAWGVVGCLTAVIIVAVSWATHRVTRAQGDINYLSTEVRRLTDTTQLGQRELDTLRRQAEEARIAAASAKTELSLLRHTQRPATQPSFWKRLTMSVTRDPE